MSTTRSRRLAIFGTFDVENYGDLLFPMIAQRRLDPHGVAVVPVSPTAGRTRYRDALPPISQDDFFRRVGDFSGVLIGGGNIVHLRNFGLPGYPATAYPALWIGATAAAVEHGIPVLWNAPGALAPREIGASPDWLRRTVASADRFAVRDKASADELERWSGRRPTVMPDTALDLPMLWAAPALAKLYKEIRARLAIPENRHVVALHVKQRSLAGQDIAAFSQTLAAALDRTGSVAILVALGRCHGDHEVAQAIQIATAGRTVLFADATRLDEIAAVLAGADAYLGASLHGHITAAAYGTPSRLVAVPALAKFAGQAQQMDRSTDVVTDWSEALRDLPEVLTQKRSILPRDIKGALDGHWERIVDVLRSDRRISRESIFANPDLGAELAATMSAGEPTSKSRPTGLSAKAKPVHQPAREINLVGDMQVKWDKSEVDQLIAAGDHASAAAQIEAALQSQPGLLPARMAKVRLALGRLEFAGATELATLLVQEHPQNPWVWLLRIQSLVQAGRHDEAVQEFTEGLTRIQPSESAMAGALNCLLQVLPMRAQVPLLQASLNATPGNVALQLKLAMRAHAVGQYQLAHDMLTAAERAGPLPDYARRMRSRLYPMLGSMEQAADLVAAELANGAEDVETLARACRYAAAAGRFDAAKTALYRLLELHPLEHRTLYRLNRVFLTADEDAKTFGVLSTKAAQTDPGASWWLQFALFALRAGQRDTGCHILHRLSGDPIAGSMARPLLSAIDTLGESGPRHNVTADADVRVVQVEGARGTIFMFGGLQGGLSLLNERYIDALLQKVPAHIVFLRDPYGRAYLNGIPELGATEDVMHQALSAMAADLGGGRIITLGGSIAGYAALRAGLAIGAERVISLAGPVTPGSAHPSEPDHTRHGLEELFGDDVEAFDLRPALFQHPETRLVHVVGENYAPDIERSRSIADLENAEVIVLRGISSHHVALPAVTDGTLLRILMSALPG